MYKVVSNNNVVDLLPSEPIYIRYQNKFNRAKPTDRSSAQGFVGSDNKTVYIFPGNPRPESKAWKYATLERINEYEYARLEKLLKKQVKLCNNINNLQEARQAKIEELRKACVDKISEGIEPLLSDTYYHRFTLTLEDQLNLESLERMLNSGATRVIYHEAGKLSKVYSAEDIRTVIKYADQYKYYQLTYFNILKNCINNMYDIDQIETIYYGVDLHKLDVSLDLINLLNEVNHVR